MSKKNAIRPSVTWLGTEPYGVLSKLDKPCRAPSPASISDKEIKWHNRENQEIANPFPEMKK